MGTLTPILHHGRHGGYLLRIQHLLLNDHHKTHSRLQPREDDLLLDLVNRALEQAQTRSPNQERLNLPSHPNSFPTFSIAI